ncbi:hypothetical protein [Novosphingobium album (ex Liu et al. 2023)]|uniref:Uracil-DNA glycosylase-like domain-containing protein n=1 Tax=Novosphingobium album (ex Liu et al. 2023) TaxID=3031130 RepID=A0ABT5WRR7_9SPHN|nr:hypothetical protein [Novosphingobium album (ex Liu et al. 2023)]MDE8652727.1 hypothetical protein [Novosphingobium album (ex Liu et al. 2023)]
MDKRANPAVAEEFAAALDWWRDAGVDRVFADEPAQWLAPPEPGPESAPERDGPRDGPAAERDRPAPRAARAPSAFGPAVAPPAPSLDIAALPADLDSFRAWWLADPALDEGGASGRVPPRGPGGAPIMVLVPEPEREDREVLLSGAQGRLLDAMLGAMLGAAGLARESAYVASVLPRHTPGFDWDGAPAGNLGAILRRHIALVAPKGIISLGFNILPLIGHEWPQRPAILRSFNHEGLTIPMLATRSLPALLERPGWKAAVWRAWLDWGLEWDRA